MANNLISKVVKRLAACASVGALVLGATWGMASAGELIVYSAVDPEEVPLYKGAFEKAYPNIKLSIVRGSTGTTTARILAARPTSELMGWLKLLAAFDIVFCVLAILLYEATLDE